MINENGDEFMWTKRGPNWVLHIRRKAEIERDLQLAKLVGLMMNVQQSAGPYQDNMTVLHNYSGSLSESWRQSGWCPF